MSDTLSFAALVGSPIPIEDSTGRVWLADDRVSMGNLLAIMKLGQGDAEGVDVADLQRFASSLWTVFRRHTPEATAQDFEDAFTIDEMAEIVSFLSDRMSLKRTGEATSTMTTPKPAKR